jgi:hypothetical protein
VRQLFFCVVIVLCVVCNSPAWGISVDFESFPDSTALTAQIAGLTLTNATVITAGISLNESEFPPHSGTNVIFDAGGPITIHFTSLVSAVGAYFTHALPLTFTAFNATLTPVATLASAFSSNMALSGDLGSSPNEFLGVTFAAGIAQVTIRGDLAGNSFTLDDLTFTSTATSVPEPATLPLLGSGLAALVGFWRARVLTSGREEREAAL